MEKEELQELKKELAAKYRDDIKNIIVTKKLPAELTSSSCGTSKLNDSMFISLEVDTIAGPIRVDIHFRNNVNELFSLDHYDRLDVDAHINTLAFEYKLLTLARIRVVRAVYEVVKEVMQDILGVSNDTKSIEADIDETTGKIDYVLENIFL